MIHLSLLLAVLQTAAVTPAAEPGPTPLATMEGPLRVELLAFGENRVRYLRQPPGQAARSVLQMQFRLAGARLSEVFKLGNLVFTRAEDDTGRSLIAEDTFTQEYIQEMRPVSAQSGISEGLLLAVRLEAASRQARAIAAMEGYVNVVTGAGTEEITIENPLQYQGRLVEHPRLAALDIEIRVLPLEQLAPPYRSERPIALQFVRGESRVRSVDFYDAWLRRMVVRPGPATTAGGEPCTVYRIGIGQPSEDMVAVLTVFERIEEIRVPAEFHNVELP